MSQKISHAKNKTDGNFTKEDREERITDTEPRRKKKQGGKITQKLHDNVEQESQTSKELKIILRRQKVWNLHKQGYNQIEIAEKLVVSAKTISRDFQDLKSEAIEWMNALPEGEVQLHHKKSIEAVEQVLQELWKSYKNIKDESMKIRILALIADKTKMYSEMISRKNVLDIRSHTQHELKIRNMFGVYPSQQ